jgi:hypothetical protein
MSSSNMLRIEIANDKSEEAHSAHKYNGIIHAIQ